MSNKHIVPYSNSFTDEGMGLYPDTISNNYACLNFNKWTNQTIIANFTTEEINQ
jgi:hypothetical protein